MCSCCGQLGDIPTGSLVLYKENYSVRVAEMLEPFVAHSLRPEPQITTEGGLLQAGPLELPEANWAGELCCRSSAIAEPERPSAHSHGLEPQPQEASPDALTSTGFEAGGSGRDRTLVVPSLGATIPSRPLPTPISPPQTPPLTPIAGGVAITNLQFSGLEGDQGIFQIKLAQAPTTSVTVSFTSGDFLVVDADNSVANGMQSSLTFTAQNWDSYQTVRFWAEKDGVATDRTTGNAIAYTLAGGVTSSGSYDLGVITNTYAPDLNKFDITLDFRTDALGFWTAARQAIAQKAADDWAERIANEWTGLQLNQVIQPIGNDGNYTTQNFNLKAYVDDLLVVVGSIDTQGGAGGYGSPVYEVGGWFGSPQLQTRLGQIAIDLSITDEDDLYNLFSHELGHVLGLIGYNWEGYLQQDLSSPQTAVFKGAYATAANNGNFIPLQSQDGPNPITNTYDYWHPAASVTSIMSYNWLYTVSGPTEIDYAMLADSGYLVYGINQPYPTVPTGAIAAGDELTPPVATPLPTDASTTALSTPEPSATESPTPELLITEPLSTPEPLLTDLEPVGTAA